MGTQKSPTSESSIRYISTGPGTRNDSAKETEDSGRQLFENSLSFVAHTHFSFKVLTDEENKQH